MINVFHFLHARNDDEDLDAIGSCILDAFAINVWLWRYASSVASRASFITLERYSAHETVAPARTSAAMISVRPLMRANDSGE